MEAPRKLLFYNRGVFLALKDSPVLSEFKGLEEMGVGLLVCGTCLDFYKVRDRLAVGQVSNMFSNLITKEKEGELWKNPKPLTQTHSGPKWVPNPSRSGKLF